MRILRVAGVLVALAAATVALPARADDPGLTLQLSIGWDGGGVAGSWVPYQVNVRNDSSSRDFNGSLVIRPRGPSAGTAGSGSSYGTTYAQALTVPHASQRTLTIYGAYLDVSGGGSGYIAELDDRVGTMVARSPVAAMNSGRLAIGLLSDSLQVAGQIKDVPLLAASTGVVQITPQTLPGGAAQLSGLSVIVIDNFDTSALSQAQVQALEQYVALGGQLVLAGGAGWRRTLSQLPPRLVPLQPQGTTAASLEPVLDLLAGHTALVAPAVVGALAPGARLVLADGSSNPLLAELNYGAGRIVEVAFDPADEPVASHAEEVRATWAVILDRITPAVGYSRPSATGVVLAPGPGQVVPNRGTTDDVLSALLNDTPANALPPLRILGGLLVVYILVAGPLNYRILRRMRRRELMWVTIPLIAVLFTAGSYGAGILVHGRDYYVNEIQVLRVAPGGAVDVASYDAIFAPSRGDVAVQLPAASLASTYLPVPSGLGQGSEDRVVTGPNPLVSLRNLAIWTSRDFKTEATTRAAIGVNAHLGIENGKVSGTVTNTGRTAVRKLTLFTTDGRSALVAGLLAPGSTLDVAVPLRPAPTQPGTSAACQASACLDAGTDVVPAPIDKAYAVQAAAAGMVSSQASQVAALTGIVDGLPGFRVGGLVPTRTLVAAFAMPLTLDSIDVMPANGSAPRLVASNGLTGNPVSIVDYELPRLPAAAQLKLSAGGASPIGSPGLPGQKPLVEIYDWATAVWSPADLSHSFLISAGQRGPDLVRLRIRGSLYLPGLQVTGR